ncbi:uncharacterized protein OCT59_002039 [Rhizophagus irregularis]|uniref:uncharacterized protein n=1 Tax=Rhizophagus irregularis TaxID=588596 RepID=UPI0033270F3D|nr:hypothetical protein OCT59_002039 [Rhizophagus irregularis]
MMNVNQEVDQEVATSQHQEVNVQKVTSSQNKSNIVKFVVDINKNMESLGINSLNISSNQEAILDSKEFGIFKILFNKEENTILQAANVAPRSSSLLEKLSTSTKEEFEAEIENQNNKDFLKVYYSEEEEEKVVIDFQNELNFPEIISETNLLKLDSDFDIIKENTIKTLVNHLIKVYDKILEEHIETEIRRRRKFRGYVNFLMIYQKIEVYYINFFKSTISNAAYEVWLKLIETGLIMTKEEGQTIYNYKKIEENYLREYKLQRIYKSIQASDHDDTGSPKYYFNENDDGDNDEMIID